MKLVNHRYKSFYRVVCFLLAVHFLNFSVDPRDPQPDSIPEDLTFNEMESVTEVVAEAIFGFTNAFAEHDEDDAEDGSSLDTLKFYFNNYSVAVHKLALAALLDSCHFKRHSQIFISPFREIISPPPKA